MIMSKLARVKEWVLAANPGVDDITPDEDLIDTRLVDSLRFLELLALLEELTGQDMTAAGRDLRRFRSLRSIDEEILKGEV